MSRSLFNGRVRYREVSLGRAMSFSFACIEKARE
jgi:hypothetical protein